MPYGHLIAATVVTLGVCQGCKLFSAYATMSVSVCLCVHWVAVHAGKRGGIISRYAIATASPLVSILTSVSRGPLWYKSFLYYMSRMCIMVTVRRRPEGNIY